MPLWTLSSLLPASRPLTTFCIPFLWWDIDTAGDRVSAWLLLFLLLVCYSAALMNILYGSLSPLSQTCSKTSSHPCLSISSIGLDCILLVTHLPCSVVTLAIYISSCSAPALTSLLLWHPSLFGDRKSSRWLSFETWWIRAVCFRAIADVAMTSLMQPCISTHTYHGMIESFRLEKTTKFT